MNHPHLFALLGAPLLLGSPLTANAQEASSEVSVPALTQANADGAASSESLSLEEAEAKLKAMNERLKAISLELSEVSEESQEVVNAALSAVGEAKKAKSQGATSSSPSRTRTVITGAGDPSATASSHLIIEGLGTTQQPLQLRVQPSTAPSLTFPQGLTTHTQSTTFRNGQVTITRSSQPSPTPTIDRHSARWSTHSKNHAKARADALRLQADQRRRLHGKKSSERVAFSGNAIIEEGEVVRELVLFSGNAEVKGDVERDVILLAGNLLVREGATIGGDAVVLAGNLTVEDGAHIQGDTVVSAGQLNVEEGAYVRGEQVEMDLDRLKSFNQWRDNIKISHTIEHDQEALEESEDVSTLFSTLSDVATRFFFLAAAGLLLMTVLPSRVKMVGSTLRSRLGASAFIGLLAAFSVVPLGAVLTVSLIGIPLVPVLGAGVAFAFVMGMVAVASELGRILPFGGRVPGWLIASGALCLAGLSIIPSAGPIIIALFAFPGFGAVLLSRFGDDGDEASAS